MYYEIITKRVLNEHTGEWETQDFKRVDNQRKNIKGGFSMMYKQWDEAVISCISSKKDLEIIIYIRDLFTYMRVENQLHRGDIAKKLNISKQKVNTIVKNMINENILTRVDRGVYRLNPFMFLPYKADAETLQKEWIELENQKKETEKE